MSTVSSTMNEPTRGRGRPRDEEVRKKILNSAACLLESRSFSEITVNAIAEHAGAGKATVYRWWPNKAAVLIEAFRVAVARDLPFPNSGSLINDLRQQLLQFAEIISGSRGRTFSGFIAAAQTDPDVAEAFRRMWIAPRRAETKKALERYRRTGDVSPEADLDAVLEMLFGPLYYRLLFAWGPVNEVYIDKLLNTALQGFGNKQGKPARPARKDDNK
jgi:AcrR family transcriptional regulator